jgi:NAD(P)-dependent dehydrogenase (short-subunit alcohol dehydrogenase family)
MTLENQRVVVLGGTSGIGLATARGALDRGAEVVITGRDQDKLRTAADDLGARATAIRADATDPEELEGLFQGLGRFDHLVLALSGGSAGAGPIGALALADLRAAFEGKFWAHVAALQAGLPHIRPRGSFTFVSAISAGAPMPGVAGLAAVNGAIEAMIPALAVELKPLRVNAVSPGVIDTPWWHGLQEDERSALFAQYASATPVGRVGAADDIAQAIISMISNGFITGTVLRVDGGLTLTAAAA